METTNISIAEAEALQIELSSKIIFQDQFKELKIIAGCDVEYDKESDTIFAAFVLFDYQTKQVIESTSYKTQVTFPYVPGLFSFREMPALLGAYQKLQLKPDVIICDGQGFAHPRGFGLACHLGIVLDTSTLGCGKTRLCGTFEMPSDERGSQSNLVDETTNQVIGVVLRTQPHVNPVFISVGHKISLSTASNLVLHFCANYRLPETTRMADAYAREAKEKDMQDFNPPITDARNG